MANVNSISSYWSELEDMFWSLKHMEYLDITPREVMQWSYNERSDTSSRDSPNWLFGMIQIDADIILVTHHLKTKLQFTVDCQYIYVHQDRKNKKQKKKRGEERGSGDESFNMETESESGISGPKESYVNR